MYRFEPIGVVELAERAGRDYTTVSRQVAKLQELGLIERRENPVDRRVSQTMLSAKGRKTANTLIKAREKVIAPITENWSNKDLGDLTRLPEPRQRIGPARVHVERRLIQFRRQFLDIGFVGEIDAINPAVVKALQDDAFIPIISPIGFGEDGQAYNINADLVAGKIAEILKAEKLIMMTNIPGVMDKNGQLVTDLSAREIDEMFEDGTISGGMLPKISSALDAAKSGVNTVHIIDGRIEHSLLLEVLTEQAFGTMIRSH